MADPIPYAYKALYLTKKETDDGRNLGLRFVLEHKDRWEDIPDSTYEIQTYNNGTSQIVHNNKLYMIHRDFIFIDSAERVFLCKCYEAEVDTYVEPTETEEDEGFKPDSIKVAGQYDYLEKKNAEKSTENTKEEVSEESETETE